MANSFEENIQQVINDHPDFPVNEQMFTDILGQLASDKAKTKKLPILFWLLLLLLGFLFSSFLAGFFYYKQKNTQKELANFISKMHTEKYVLKDTVYEKQFTILYDTIHQTYILANNDNRVNNQPLQNLYYSTFADYRHPRFSFNAKLGNSFYNDYNKINPNSIQNHPYFGKRYLSLKPEGFEDLGTAGQTNYSIAKIDKLEVTELEYEKEIFLFKGNRNLLNNKSWLKRTWDEVLTFRDKSIHFLSPKHFAISMPVGRFKQLNLASYKGNSSWAIQAEVGLNDNLSWVVGTEYLSTSFGQLFNDINVNTLSNFPTISPNTSSDKLHEIYGRFDYVQIPIGLKYTFLRKSKVRPYVGVGLTPSLPIKSNLKYEFLSPAEYYLQKTGVLSSKFILADYWATAGTYYLYNSIWRFGIEGGLQKSFQKSVYKYQDHQFLKWNLSVQYKF